MKLQASLAAVGILAAASLSQCGAQEGNKLTQPTLKHTGDIRVVGCSITPLHLALAQLEIVNSSPKEIRDYYFNVTFVSGKTIVARVSDSVHNVIPGQHVSETAVSDNYVNTFVKCEIVNSSVSAA